MHCIHMFLGLPDPDPDPLVRGRIHTKMSWIPNTAINGRLSKTRKFWRKLPERSTLKEEINQFYLIFSSDGDSTFKKISA
jgi:hypothetical protein